MNNNPAAFPLQVGSQWQIGMSLRDWLAGQALVGLLANPESTDFPAIRAYQHADSMLVARKRETRPL